MKRILFAATALLATACSDTSGPDNVPCDPALLQLGAVAGDTVTTQSGLRYIDVRVGTGTEARVGHAVRSHYSGYLASGTRFDSSCPREETLPYTLPGNVVQGFWEGTVGMRVGGVRRLIIPASLGYGATPRPGIPANSTLIFDVQLAEILND